MKNILKATILSGILLLTFCLTKFEQTSIQPLLDIYSYITQREAALWNTFESHGIIKNKFEKLKQERNKNKNKRYGQKTTPENLNLIHQVATDFGIDPTTLVIETVTNVNSCEAWVNHQTLQINEPAFTQADAKTKSFIIAHELQHILHNDHDDRYILGSLTAQRVKDPETENELMNSFYRFQEERADALAAAKNIDYAKSYVHCMHYFKDKYGLMDKPEHPKLSDRIDLADRIVAGFETKIV